MNSIAEEPIDSVAKNSKGGRRHFREDDEEEEEANDDTVPQKDDQVSPSLDAHNEPFEGDTDEAEHHN